MKVLLPHVATLFLFLLLGLVATVVIYMATGGGIGFMTGPVFIIFMVANYKRVRRRLSKVLGTSEPEAADRRSATSVPATDEPSSHADLDQPSQMGTQDEIIEDKQFRDRAGFDSDIRTF